MKLFLGTTLLVSCGLLVGMFGFAYRAHAANITISPPKFEFATDPGGRIIDSIIVTNNDDAELVLTSSVANFSASGESGTAAFSEDEHARAFSLASWITLPNDVIRVPAHEKTEVPIVITIPDYAEAGGHFGTVFFTPVTAGGGAISIKQKVGILLLVRVSGDVREEATITIFDTYDSQQSEDSIATARSRYVFGSYPVNFAVRVNNTGNVHVKPKGAITMSNMRGKKLRNIGEEAIFNDQGAVIGTKLVDYIPVNDRGGNVLPDSARVFLLGWKGTGSNTLSDQDERIIQWGGIGFGRYTATLTLALNETTTDVQTIHFWIIPWKLISATALLLVVLLSGVRWRRRSLREKIKRELAA